MPITHHPDIPTLMSCAAGSQPEAFAAIVASHLAICPECVREMGKMQDIGVALFDMLSPAAMTSEAPIIAARARETDIEPHSSSATAGDIPAPLKPLLGGTLAQVPWRRITRSVWQYRVPLSKTARGDLRLVKVAPGTRLPEHMHRGTELTLVLEGSYHDKFGTFRRGDVADLDEETEHQPIADETTGCVCLIATDRSLAYKGLLARLLQPLLGY